MKSATSFSRSGLSDWLIQRVSAIILAAYTVWLFGFSSSTQTLITLHGMRL